MKGLRVTNIIREIKFEGGWGRLEAKDCFQRQPYKKYLRQTLAFCELSHYGKGSISIFEEFSATTDKIFILGGRLGTRLLPHEDLRFF